MLNINPKILSNGWYRGNKSLSDLWIIFNLHERFKVIQGETI